jgi:hypothetical protein
MANSTANQRSALTELFCGKPTQRQVMRRLHRFLQRTYQGYVFALSEKPDGSTTIKVAGLLPGQGCAQLKAVCVSYLQGAENTYRSQA